MIVHQFFICLTVAGEFWELLHVECSKARGELVDRVAAQPERNQGVDGRKKVFPAPLNPLGMAPMTILNSSSVPLYLNRSGLARRSPALISTKFCLSCGLEFRRI